MYFGLEALVSVNFQVPLLDVAEAPFAAILLFVS